MRDPKRIPEVLEALRAYWESEPDMRLGQILGNVSSHMRTTSDPYYMEDDVFLKGLDLLTPGRANNNERKREDDNSSNS